MRAWTWGKVTNLILILVRMMFGISPLSSLKRKSIDSKAVIISEEILNTDLPKELILLAEYSANQYKYVNILTQCWNISDGYLGSKGEMQDWIELENTDSLAVHLASSHAGERFIIAGDRMVALYELHLTLSEEVGLIDVFLCNGTRNCGLWHRPPQDECSDNPVFVPVTAHGLMHWTAWKCNNIFAFGH